VADDDDDEWIEKVVKVAAALGMNPMRTRWKLRRWQERRRQNARRREQQVEHIRYAHKTCDVCGAVQDRDETVCSRCNAKLGRREVQVLRRIGLAMPVAISASTLVGVSLVAVYVRVLVASGGGLGAPPIDVLIHFGGHWPPLVSEEPWRLLTSIFLHAGLWHLAFNMIAIAMVGPRVESAYGRGTLIFLLLATGILANVGSGLAGLAGVGVGASGGVMGLIGAMAGHGHRVGTWAGRALRNDMLKWSGYTILFGFFVHADNWAHLFGGLVGAAFGYAVSPERWRATARVIAGVVGILLAVGALAIIFTRGPVPPPKTEYELSYAPYAKVCRKYFDGDHEGARNDLLPLAPRDTSARAIERMCVAFLVARDQCRTSATDRQGCELIEHAFGSFKERPDSYP